MSKVLITGIPGTGKSTVVRLLNACGHRGVDAALSRWSWWVPLGDGSFDWVWREDAIAELLAGDHEDGLFVAGCATNQAMFYGDFDHVVLLSAPVDVLVGRATGLTGSAADQRNSLVEYVILVEPLFRASATLEIDATAPVEEVVRQLEGLV